MATIVTDIGNAKLLVATPMAPVTLSHIAFGDGSGSIPTLNPAATSLVNELIRVDCSNPVKDTTDPTVLKVSGGIPRSYGGVVFREVGLFDADGDLIAVGQLSNIVIPTPTDEYGFTFSGSIRIKLSSSELTEVINSDAPAFDHRGLTFRDETDAHPASSITTVAGRTVQATFSVQKLLSSSGTLIIGENNILSSNTTQTLPSVSGLTAGSKVIVSKYSTVLATVDTTGAEQIRVGSTSLDYLDFDSLLLDDNGLVTFTWTGTLWECNL